MIDSKKIISVFTGEIRYTYFNGKRVYLTPLPDGVVVRYKREEFEISGLDMTEPDIFTKLADLINKTL